MSSNLCLRIEDEGRALARALSDSAQARYLRYMSLRKMDGSSAIHCPMAVITAARMSSDTSLKRRSA